MPVESPTCKISDTSFVVANTGSATVNTCPLTNNCLVGGSSSLDQKLSSACKKTAEATRLEFNSLVTSAGTDPLLFITQTFVDPVPSRVDREALYDKFKKAVLLKNFTHGFTVFDRSPSGRPHFHIIAVGDSTTNYRAGFDFGAWHASQDFEQRWNRSGHTDHNAESKWRASTATYTRSASPDLRAIWATLSNASVRHGFGRINALPIKDPVACSFYLAKCITNGFRDSYPDDRGIRRIRFWGKFPRKVSLKFHRVTQRSTWWRGKLAFCAQVLGFDELEDFARVFGPRWFIYMKGIIRLVPNQLAEAALLTPHVRLDLTDWERRRVRKVEVELLGRIDRFGRFSNSRG